MGLCNEAFFPLEGCRDLRKTHIFCTPHVVTVVQADPLARLAARPVMSWAGDLTCQGSLKAQLVQLGRNLMANMANECQ